MIDTATALFSPLFAGSEEAWEWICAATNHRPLPDVQLNAAQRDYAERNGWLPQPAIKSKVAVIDG